ncbi:hypothetical protein DOTSEDRAFT_71106 [Dothistroma septosporum NZE10]|uniref:Copper acquisition factor BIM1-like domain-containing protein n=1 Tax=Dothistroma septosporum (strain NZE10 / CBS 128990) TaxID=675120 RepID=N1PQR7_DOTSN|nr:hypothetical protein DOTSEDRAFT_71106 [Dothistroma septosporum NZE10]
MYGLKKTIAAAVAVCSVASAHTVITYPGWRGNNLHANGTAPEQDPNTLGINYFANNDSYAFPYGMQWMYPCGGMPMTSNRTKWPVGGGAVSVQPGWFPGHSKAFFYINIGIQEEGMQAPPNYSHPVVPVFQITGPSNTQYPGQFCLPQVRMPANLSLTEGTNITIQVVEAAQHGAALYSCVDVTLTKPEDVEQVTPQNCYNSTDLGFDLVFSTGALTSGAISSISGPSPLIFFVGLVLSTILTLR